AHRTRKDIVLGEPRHNLFGGQPFGNGDGMLNDLAFDDGGNDVAQARVFLESIFAGLEVGARLQGQHRADKGPAIVLDDALAYQDVGDVTHSRARWNVDGLVLPQWTCRFDLLLAVEVTAAHRDHQHQHDRDDGIADDDERVSGAIGALRRRRHLLGLERGTRAAGRNGRPFTHRCNLVPAGLIVAGQILILPIAY